MTGSEEPIFKAFDREVGRRVSVYRTEKRMSRSALARKIGVHRNTLSRWERGLQSVRLIELLRVADILELSFMLLLPAPEFVWALQPPGPAPAVRFPPKKQVRRVTFSEIQSERDPMLTRVERRLA